MSKLKGKEKIFEKANELFQKFKADKKLLLIVGIGIIGMVLLLASELVSQPDQKKSSGKEPTVESGQFREEDTQELEKKLTEIVTSIQGVGKAKVMVTLENSAETVYASQGKESGETDSASGQEEKSKYSREDEYVIIKKNGSDENGLLIKVLEPKIRGVAIVCEGGDSVYVKQRVSEAVAAVLNISSARISISKMAND